MKKIVNARIDVTLKFRRLVGCGRLEKYVHSSVFRAGSPNLMQSLNWYVRRLQSMSPAEIAWRVRGLLRDQADLVRVPLGIVPKLPAGAPASFDGFKPGFTCSPVTGDHWPDSKSDIMQDWLDRLTGQADNILENRLSYFNLENVDHGTPFNWHRDHSAEIDSPIRLSVLTDYRDFATYGDCKLVWEPNRHHQFVVLARAYVATGDDRYAEKLAELLRSWIDANPFGYGMNWKSVLEHGVRIINWVWALDLIRGSGAIDDDLWGDIQQSAYLAIWDGQRKFSRGSSANNHLIGEAAGVFIGACYFQHFPNSDHWARKAKAVLEREILLQTYPDGCTQEHAFGYQFFVIQFFQLCMRAGAASGYPFSDQFQSRLHNMFRFMNEISLDTGEPPNMGDRDDGYVLDLGELPKQARELLSVGGHLFGDPELVTSAASETVFWLTGDAKQQITQPRPPPASKAFPAPGYFILRSDRVSVFFDAAPLGYGPIAAHGHADCLSFCLAIDGKPVMIDPGTFDYFTHPEWRNFFRETRSHNTAEVDGESQSELQGPFMWGHRATATVNEWIDSDLRTFVSAQHDGYECLTDPLTHKREIQLDKNTNEVLITEHFSCQGRHSIVLYFHLDPDCNVSAIDDRTAEISGSWGTLHLSSNMAEIERSDPGDLPGPGWISRGYHDRQKSVCLVVRMNIDGGSSHISTIRFLDPA